MKRPSVSWRINKPINAYNNPFQLSGPILILLHIHGHEKPNRMFACIDLSLIFVIVFFDFTVNIRCKGNDFCLTAKYFQYIFAQNTG